MTNKLISEAKAKEKDGDILVRLVFIKVLYEKIREIFSYKSKLETYMQLLRNMRRRLVFLEEVTMYLRTTFM